ncbi:MAG: 8-amino-7-oxononanoate synthase [Verrucomicrobiae bacterium]|nr:8-amino-7-oxononanoate synthase [Verrucomicrobiae bacterium]
MTNSFENFLSNELKIIQQQNLLRQLHNRNEKPYYNFSSNDYLGLNHHPALKEAAIQALEDYGSGTGASRLICGHFKIHQQLEEALAQFKKTEAALTFSSGYATAVGAIPSLVGKEDVIILDKLCHACLIDAAKLSQAKLRIFKHNHLEQLESHLKWAQSHKKEKKSKILIITEAVFSMDGDWSLLKEIVTLKEKYGAWLFVDEAHSTGIFGKTRAGLCQHLNVNDHVEIQMGTLSKAIGVSGGYIAGSRSLIDFLINRARSFIFSTAVPATNAAAALASLRLISSAEGQHRCETLWQLVDQFKQGLVNNTLGQSPIFPIILGDSKKALTAAENLKAKGFWIPAIRYPTVPKNQARLRVTLSASHSSQTITELIETLNAII